MKKYILFLITILSILLTTACDNTMNTPTRKIEDYLMKYQKLDKEVIMDLESSIDKDENMSKEQKDKYKDIMKKQYQNLSYKIKEEIINKDNATVDVEIEVLDYQSSITKSKKYFSENREEYTKDTNKEIESIKEYIDYKLEELGKVDDKIKYEITYSLSKEDGKWIIDKITDTDIKKIHGLY